MMLFDTLRLIAVEGAGWRVEFYDALGNLVYRSMKLYACREDAIADLRFFAACIKLL